MRKTGEVVSFNPEPKNSLAAFRQVNAEALLKVQQDQKKAEDKEKLLRVDSGHNSQTVDQSIPYEAQDVQDS